MKTYLSILIALIGLVSCNNKPNYEDISNHPDFNDLLYNSTFLKEVKAISYTDSFKTQLGQSTSYSYYDSLTLSNPYLLEGMQNIDIFNELNSSYQLNKPLLVYFNAFACVNCRKMEEKVLNDPKISTFIDENFKLITLCVDDNTSLPNEYRIKFPLKKSRAKFAKTIGGVNSTLQIILTSSGSQPMFVALDLSKNLGMTAYTPQKEDFLSFLEKTIKKYKENQIDPMPENETYKINWRNEAIGELTQGVIDMYFLEGKWKSYHSEKSLAFENLAKDFDAKEVLSDFTKGTRIQLGYQDSDETIHAVVISLQDNWLFVRKVFHKEAIEWLIK